MSQLTIKEGDEVLVRGTAKRIDATEVVVRVRVEEGMSTIYVHRDDVRPANADHDREPQPWTPEKNAKILRLLGKLGEELGECSAAVSRCIIQGIDETEPVTNKLNRNWLTEEISDVLLNAHLAIDLLGLEANQINARWRRKEPLLRKWHGEA